jgi:hypothetical protein
VVLNITVNQNKLDQNITFNSASVITMDQSPYTLSATASSNLPVSFTSSPASICTVSGTALTLVAAGNCVVITRQAGNSTYAAAPELIRTISFTSAMLSSPEMLNSYQSGSTLTRIGVGRLIIQLP